MTDTSNFQGLVYMKHGRIGTRSEGPDYWLQMYNGERLLHFHARNLWEPDFELDHYQGRIVTVAGELDGDVIQVQRIWALPLSYIPREDTRPHLGDALGLGVGERTVFADAPLTIAFGQVVEDSRCPIGARCIWEGEAVVAIEVAPDGAAAEQVKVTLRAGHDDLASATAGGYKVEIKRLDPYPGSGGPVPAKPTVTLVVTRAAG